jgi:hypothetical protein
MTALQRILDFAQYRASREQTKGKLSAADIAKVYKERVKFADSTEAPSAHQFNIT